MTTIRHYDTKTESLGKVQEEMIKARRRLDTFKIYLDQCRSICKEQESVGLNGIRGGFVVGAGIIKPVGFDVDVKTMHTDYSTYVKNSLTYQSNVKKNLQIQRSITKIENKREDLRVARKHIAEIYRIVNTAIPFVPPTGAITSPPFGIFAVEMDNYVRKTKLRVILPVVNGTLNYVPVFSNRFPGLFSSLYAYSTRVNNITSLVANIQGSCVYLINKGITTDPDLLTKITIPDVISKILNGFYYMSPHVILTELTILFDTINDHGLKYDRQYIIDKVINLKQEFIRMCLLIPQLGSPAIPRFGNVQNRILTAESEFIIETDEQTKVKKLKALIALLITSINVVFIQTTTDTTITAIRTALDYTTISVLQKGKVKAFLTDLKIVRGVTEADLITYIKKEFIILGTSIYSAYFNSLAYYYQVSHSYTLMNNTKSSFFADITDRQQRLTKKEVVVRKLKLKPVIGTIAYPDAELAPLLQQITNPLGGTGTIASMNNSMTDIVTNLRKTFSTYSSSALLCLQLLVSMVENDNTIQYGGVFNKPIDYKITDTLQVLIPIPVALRNPIDIATWDSLIAPEQINLINVNKQFKYRATDPIDINVLTNMMHLINTASVVCDIIPTIYYANTIMTGISAPSDPIKIKININILTKVVKILEQVDEAIRSNTDKTFGLEQILIRSSQTYRKILEKLSITDPTVTGSVAVCDNIQLWIKSIIYF